MEEKMKDYLLLIVLLFALTSCADSGHHREYITNIDGGSGPLFVSINLDLDADVLSEAKSGEAAPTVSPTTALGMQGSTTSAAGGAQLLERLKSAFDQLLKNEIAQPQQPEPAPAPSPEPAPAPTPTPAPEPEPDPGEIDLGEYDIVAEAVCDKQMSYRDNTESEGVIQKKCVFAKAGPEYGKSFVIQWSSGNKLRVPDSGKMAWLVKNETGGKDYRKYQPQEPVEGGGYKPGTPAEVYAGRGDNSTRAYILVKKTGADPAPDKTIRVVWADLGCRDPDPDYDRLCWTKIHGAAEPRWWRKFPLPTWLDDKSYAMSCTFSDGTVADVPDTRKMAMKSSDGPKYLPQHSNEPRKRHPKISEKYGAKAQWVECKIEGGMS